MGLKSDKNTFLRLTWLAKFEENSDAYSNPKAAKRGRMKKTVLYVSLAIISIFAIVNLGFGATLVYLSQEKQIESQLSAMAGRHRSPISNPSSA